jgi:hypothetical protein
MNYPQFDVLQEDALRNDSLFSSNVDSQCMSGSAELASVFTKIVE